ncbi:MAG: energy transducer TonB family protein [Gemmatimonadota bacterium]
MMERRTEPDRPEERGRGRPSPLPASVRGARRHRPVWALALLASIGLHLLVFLLWSGTTPFPTAWPPGLRTADEAAAGGGALRAVRVRLPRRTEIPPPPRPVLAVELPVVEVAFEEPSGAQPDLSLPAAGRLSGPGSGGAAGAGRGAGGDGADYVPPVPRTVIPHWDPPASVRGMEVTVRVHVDEQGRATGRVELRPPTPDRSFNREIVDRVRRMEYRPAQRNGIPISGWAEITFIF